MRTIIAVLIVALMASLVGNVLLWQALSLNHSDSVSFAPTDATPAKTYDPDRQQSHESQPDISSPAYSDISNAIENDQFENARLGLAEQLRRNPNDVRLLMLEAQFLLKTAPLSEAVIHYYELLEKPLSADQRLDIETLINDRIKTAIAQLKGAAEWDLLAQFIEPLFQRFPDHRVFILGLAEAYGQQAKYTLMEDVLATLSDDDSGANAIRNRVYTPEPETAADSPASAESRDVTRIALNYERNRYIADVFINGVDASLLIDTGATTSAVSARQFNRISRRSGFEFVGLFTVNTAGGQVQARMVKVREFELGPYVINDVSMLVLPSDNLSDVDGLLGMNVLKLFDFSIDQEANTLNLRARR